MPVILDEEANRVISSLGYLSVGMTLMLSGAGAHMPNGGPDAEEIMKIYDHKTTSGQRHALRKIFGVPAPGAPEDYLFGSFVRAVQAVFGSPVYLVTLNVDGWARESGADQVLELHGCIRDGTCTTCNEVFPNIFVKKGMSFHPRCPDCGTELEIDVSVAGDDGVADTWANRVRGQDLFVDWLGRFDRVAIIGISDYTVSFVETLSRHVQPTADVIMGNPNPDSQKELTAALRAFVERTRRASGIGAIGGYWLARESSLPAVKDFLLLAEKLDPSRRPSQPPRTRRGAVPRVENTEEEEVHAREKLKKTASRKSKGSTKRRSSKR